MVDPASKRQLDPATFDRTDFSPYHEGPNVLPHELLFHKLVWLAHHQNSVTVKDPYRGYEATHRQFLSDIIVARNKIRDALSPETMRMIRREDEVSVLIVAEGYEFVVGFFAVLALGAIAVPQSPHVSPEELAHSAKTALAHATVCSQKYVPLAQSIASRPGVRKDYRLIELEGCLMTKPMDLKSIVFSSNKPLDQNKPCVIIFTSGSTGPPKGAAARRYNVAMNVLQSGWKNNVSQGYLVLQTLPTHHATGLMVNTVPAICNGGCVEFTNPKFDAATIWERFRERGITSFSAVPTIFVRVVKHWENVISKLEEPEKNAYLDALRAIPQFHCGSAALPQYAAQKWAELCGGRHILERYGGTEFGNPFLNIQGMPYVPGSVGTDNPSVETYLENGNEGEVFMRSPFMFSKYINDIEGTRKALTKDGYFISGDIAEKVGDLYFLKGRKSVDIIKSGGYKISALDVERELLEHPKIQEAIIIGIDDLDQGQRLAAAVVLKDGVENMSLTELRADMKDRLSYYKLPTILRVVPELKKTPSLKVPKLLLKKELFESGHPDIQRMPVKAKI